MEFKRTSSTTRRQPAQSTSQPGGFPAISKSLPPRPQPRPASPPPASRPPKKPTPLLTKKRLIIAGVAIICIAGSVTAYAAHRQQPEQSAISTSWANSQKNQPAQTPDYDTVLPVGKSIESLGGWKRVTPADKTAVFAYNDTINGVVISVSEQQLPQTAKVADIAKAYNATSKLESGDVSAYIGTSAQGPQSVIFAKDKTLVLVKSQKKIDDAAWKKYISSLE